VVKPIKSINLYFPAFYQLCLAVEERFGKNCAIWLGLISASQFQLPFYATRMLPNVYALVLFLHATAMWLREGSKFPFLLTAAAATVIFRGELVIMFGLYVLSDLINKRVTFISTVTKGLLAVALTLPLTVLIDSYFWGRWLWPEGEVLYFNIVLNRSHEWGIEPWYWYFTNCAAR